MRTLTTMLGILAALILLGVSGAMNYLFLSSLGKSPPDAQVLGAASADALKALLPFFIAWAWRAGRYAVALPGLLVWASTKACTDATLPESRAFCERYFTLRAERAAEIEARRIERKIAEFKTKTERLRASEAGRDADPQVALLSRLFGHAQDRVRLALIVVVALLVEFGSSPRITARCSNGAARPFLYQSCLKPHSRRKPSASGSSRTFAWNACSPRRMAGFS